MKVLLIADAVGGVRTFTWELTRALSAAGVEVHLGLLAPGHRAVTLRDAAALPAASCQVADLRLEWMEQPWADVAAAAEWVEELRRELGPDLLHMNTFTPVLSPDMPVLLTVHSCVLSWWRAVHGTDAPSGWDRYRELVERALLRARIVTAPTRAMLAEAQRIYSRVPRARVIPCGRRGPEGSASSLQAAGRERLVLTAGRLWDAAKNVALVAEAAPSIAARVVAIGPRGPAAPAGAGELPDAEISRGGSLPEPEIHHLGPLPEAEVLRWMRRAAVFAEPARYEPFGQSALEAALSGCALVLGDIPSLREVWGESATFVAPDDPRALADAVNRLIEDPARRATAARAAARRAVRYTPETMAQAYREAYAAAVAGQVVAA